MVVEAKENHPKLNILIPRSNISTLEIKAEGQFYIQEDPTYPQGNFY